MTELFPQVSAPAPFRKWSSAHSLKVTQVLARGAGASVRVFSSSQDGSAKVHCLASGALLRHLHCSVPLRSLALSPSEGTLAAGAESGQVVLFTRWDAKGNVQVRKEGGI